MRSAIEINPHANVSLILSNRDDKFHWMKVWRGMY
jgi:hypothetical protein